MAQQAQFQIGTRSAFGIAPFRNGVALSSQATALGSPRLIDQYASQLIKPENLVDEVTAALLRKQTSG